MGGGEGREHIVAAVRLQLVIKLSTLSQLKVANKIHKYCFL